jgi:hypothetical protein
MHHIYVMFVLLLSNIMSEFTFYKRQNGENKERAGGGRVKLMYRC